MNYGQRFVTLYRRQESRPSPRKRNVKKQNAVLLQRTVANPDTIGRLSKVILRARFCLDDTEG